LTRAVSDASYGWTPSANATDTYAVPAREGAHTDKFYPSCAGFFICRPLPTGGLNQYTAITPGGGAAQHAAIAA